MNADATRDTRPRRRRAVVAASVLLAGLALTLAGLLLTRAREPRPEFVEAASGEFVADVRGRSAVVWAVGDGPDGGVAARRVAQLIASERATARVLYLGDTYPQPDGDVEELAGASGPDDRDEGDGPVDNWGTRFAGAYGRLASITAPTPGNHDWPTGAQAGYVRFWRAATGREVPAYYAFEAAGWEILSLNSEEPLDAGSRQLDWLEDELAEPGDCRIAFWHRPRFSAGERHGDQEDVEPLWDRVKGRAAIVLGGHEHNMQRFKPIAGTVQFVSGAGGHSHYGVHADDERLAFSNATDYGALRLELSAGTASWRFANLDGRTLDAGRLACEPLGSRGEGAVSAAAAQR